MEIDILIDEYSALIIMITAIFVAAVAILSRRARWQEFVMVGVISLGIFSFWWVAHPRPTPLMEDALHVQEMIGAGKPVLLEFQSPY